MRKSDFLTDIAQGYNPKIEAVYFCSQSRLPERALGMADVWESVGKYRILLNDNLLFCPIRAFYVFFHELGHIVLGHFGQMDSESQEREVNKWAFRKMGTIDQEGKIKKENAFCYVCIVRRSKECLK